VVPEKPVPPVDFLEMGVLEMARCRRAAEFVLVSSEDAGVMTAERGEVLTLWPIVCMTGW